MCASFNSLDANGFTIWGTNAFLVLESKKLGDPSLWSP